MSTTNNDFLSKINDLDDAFKSYAVYTFILIILIIFIWYLIYLTKLEKKEGNYMNGLYPSVDGNIRPITVSDPVCGHKFYDYYIKSAYNCCSGGSYKNDFVTIEALKSVLKQGVRGLDFEVYSINDQPVVATSTSDSYFVKETFNSIPFNTVIDTIRNYAFSSGTSPNPTDPVIVHIRFKSANQNMYQNLAKIFKANNDLMLGMNYSYEAEGKNLGIVPLLELKNKIVLIVDRSDTAFLDCQDFLEYVNMTSSSIFMREYTYYNVKNSPDINELIEYNKQGMTFVTPDKGVNPANPSGIVCRANGCQLVAMRYQLADNMLAENNVFFDGCGYAFCLKPEELRYKPVTVSAPTKQIPQYSYATRTMATDYYKFDF